MGEEATWSEFISQKVSNAIQAGSEIYSSITLELQSRIPVHEDQVQLKLKRECVSVMF